MGVSAVAPDRALIVFEPTTTPPAGYIKANGALLSRTAYAWLFGRIGTTYGAGDGSTTFAIPDLRGEFPRFLDDGRGVDSGRAIGSAQAGQMPSHTHSIPISSGPGAGSGKVLADYIDSVFSTTASGAAGGTLNSSENRPRNIALLGCIAYAP